MLCIHCLDSAKRKCPVCGKRKKVSDIERERLDYLLTTWYKLRKFHMSGTSTTGGPKNIGRSKSLDEQVMKEFGDWRYLAEPKLL